MFSMKHCLPLLLLLSSFVLTGSAQSQTDMPKPGPEVKKIEYFAGDWSVDGEIKPGPYGPGGKFQGTSHGEWMDGGFFLVMHTKTTAPFNMTSTAYMGYHPEKKKYIYNEFNSMGEAEAALGTVEGDTWTWLDENEIGGKTVHGRYTSKIVSPTSYKFKYEMTMDGTTWNTIMEGTASKTK
jgi:hypothetical protein